MEFLKARLFDGDVNIIFTGDCYFFFQGFYGVICIAQRDVKQSLSNSGKEFWHEKFTLYAGNRNGDIEIECFELAKKIIKKYDQKYVKKTFEFEEIVTDLNKCLVTVSYDLNRFG